MDTETLTENLRMHVYRLADVIGERNVFHPEALHAAEAYIRDTWQEQGYEVREQSYRVRDVLSTNLEVTCEGSQSDSGLLLIGAHYDSVMGSPGANDNASGVAVLLELSRLFRRMAPAHTIRFVAFVNEEPPFFLSRSQGSMVYSRAAKQRGDEIRLMVALETMGYYRDEPGSQRYPPLFRLFFPSQANFIAFVSNFRSRRKQRQLVTAFRAATDFPAEQVATFSLVPGVGWSDHLSFWIRGYHALMVTDTALYRYPWYHRAEDTAEKLDYPRLAQVTQGLFQALNSMAMQEL
jgi:Zn-dependent M28 family amino/carboxypeptidase